MEVVEQLTALAYRQGVSDKVWGALVLVEDGTGRDADTADVKNRAGRDLGRLIVFYGRRGSTLKVMAGPWEAGRACRDKFFDKDREKKREGYVEVDWRNPVNGMVNAIMDYYPAEAKRQDETKRWEDAGMCPGCGCRPGAMHRTSCSCPECGAKISNVHRTACRYRRLIPRPGARLPDDTAAFVQCDWVHPASGARCRKGTGHGGTHQLTMQDSIVTRKKLEEASEAVAAKKAPEPPKQPEIQLQWRKRRELDL